MTAKLILTIIAVLFIAEGAIVTFNPNWTKSITKKMIKKPNILRIIGITELVVGIILLISLL